MIYLYPEQLSSQLKKKINNIYILYGTNPLLLQESQNKIYKTAKKCGFNQKYSFLLDKNTNWSNIFNKCKNLHLFNNKQILSFTISNNYINDIVNKKISVLFSLCNKNLLFIVHIDKLTNYKKNYIFLKKFHHKTILINCNTPQANYLLNWILDTAKKMNILLDHKICQLLHEYYQDDLSSVVELLKNLRYIYPDDIISLTQVKKTINKLINFTPSHWINTLLSGNYKLSCHILHKLKLENIEPVILLRKLQHEILLLLTYKQQTQQNITQNLLSDKYKIKSNKHQLLLIKALKRLNFNQLSISIKIMFQLELEIKQNNIYNTWSTFEVLTLLLCQ
ncbi:DNA polymerase III subunit delta [Blochmannia endosymbiont of Camponotus (Colobopsis) obliquus]|uniref:DNA polymerase III subunit delta n=1 Tax=Blochmannia endosymbiont of Camponotus (Colobopsis) obliquus TaxID=1505597 RepID=UPI00061A6A1C|nr:DNA polymerase III subunit delta [Blochmannia endosymbiont of Camponotus (Colobopsis) obliquus]AKC60477.1 DNA polymerase III subunit delta [Blochmannia endosymbiont of Camponotus (Colobopsis) obliquus]